MRARGSPRRRVAPSLRTRVSGNARPSSGSSLGTPGRQRPARRRAGGRARDPLRASHRHVAGSDRGRADQYRLVGSRGRSPRRRRAYHAGRRTGRRKRRLLRRRLVDRSGRWGRSFVYHCREGGSQSVHDRLRQRPRMAFPRRWPSASACWLRAWSACLSWLRCSSPTFRSRWRRPPACAKRSTPSLTSSEAGQWSCWRVPSHQPPATSSWAWSFPGRSA